MEGSLGRGFAKMNDTNPKKKILFLCTGNSCRSQMAEGFLKSYLDNDNIIRSAGLTTHGVNPLAIDVMREVNIDISKHTSNNLSDYLYEKFDYIITVCENAAENCPVFPGRSHRPLLPNPGA